MQRIIYIPLLVIALVSATILLVTKLRSPRCKGIILSVPQTAKADEKVQFIDSTADVTKRIWDFGDSTEVSAEQAPTHRYAQAGKYIVSLTINNSCREVREIEVLPKPALQLQLAQIQGPSGAIYVGDPVPFSELTPDATAWEWTFGESGKVDKRDKQTSYIFHSSGYKTVTVYVTTPSGKLSGSFTVNVKDKSIDIKPQMMTPKDIAGAAKPTGAAKKKLFETKLTAFLTQDDMSARSKLFNEMLPLVCDKKENVRWITPWFKKDKNKSFEDFCGEIISDKKVYKITDLNVSFDDAKDCVSGLTVKMKGK